MDKYAPRLMAAGIKGMVGKGQRSAGVVEAMKRHGCVYFAAIGGAGALMSKSITSYRVIAFEELGPEALSLIEVKDFPAIVVIDKDGGNFYLR
jgi:fumarate hydratase subunit beta